MRRIFETLEYGPAPESPAVVNAWLDDHGRSFGHFINGTWVKPSGRKMYDSFNPATGEKIASTTQGKRERERQRRTMTKDIQRNKKKLNKISILYRHKRRH